VFCPCFVFLSYWLALLGWLGCDDIPYGLAYDKYHSGAGREYAGLGGWVGPGWLGSEVEG